MLKWQWYNSLKYSYIYNTTIEIIILENLTSLKSISNVNHF